MYYRVLSECNAYAGGDVTCVRMHDCYSLVTFPFTSHRSMIDGVCYTCLCVDSLRFNGKLQLSVSQ
jgi:hypothetical protein